jgi:hypothetical protein
VWNAEDADLFRERSLDGGHLLETLETLVVKSHHVAHSTHPQKS